MEGMPWCLEAFSQAAQLRQEGSLGYFLLRTSPPEVDPPLAQWHGAEGAAELSTNPSAMEKCVCSIYPLGP